MDPFGSYFCIADLVAVEIGSVLDLVERESLGIIFSVGSISLGCEL